MSPNTQDIYMNWDTVKGNWTPVKGNTKLQLSKPNQDHLRNIAGRQDPLTGEIQKIYGDEKQLTEEQLREFVGPHKNTRPGI